MKKLKLFILAFTIFAMHVSAAVIADPIKPNAELRAELVDLIGVNCPFTFDKDACTAEIIFTVTTNGEVIVISVNSDNPGADSYIKGKINYKKINHTVKKEGELYLLPLRIVKPS